MKEEIRRSLLAAGAIAVGFAKAGEIDQKVHEDFINWIREGCHGEMGYLERHIPLRQHTDNVLSGAKTVISLAFDYTPQEWRKGSLPYISSYAYGEDYHMLLRERLKPVVKEFKNIYGGDWRVCIDSAPMAERYWALKSGIGKRGINGAVIVKNSGALNFLVEVLTTLDLEPDPSSEEVCKRCEACVNICPVKALRGDGTMDARRCINYLTIEKRGYFTAQESELINSDSGYLYGCDRCLRACPHNKDFMHTNCAQNIFSNKIKDIMPEDILSLEEEEFKERFKKSPLLYAGYERLRRNALAIKNKSAGNN